MLFWAVSDMIPLTLERQLEVERNSVINWFIPPPISQVRKLRSEEEACQRACSYLVAELGLLTWRAVLLLWPQLATFIISGFLNSSWSALIDLPRQSLYINSHLKLPSNPLALQDFLNCLFLQLIFSLPQSPPKMASLISLYGYL